ncbi:MAG TPA: MBL fold metallo-hydrolase [Planctomycetes bacterium]|nr:MBL fold metallo-hydrolase [Planctomycetota bacterium]
MYCTGATADVAGIVLRDAAAVQEEDAAFKKKRHAREGRKSPRPVVPLYSTQDAENACRSIRSVNYNTLVPFTDGVSASWHDAGHIIGSSMIRITVNGAAPRSVLFSGDVGRWSKPVLRDPSLFDEADYVVVESTYGNRVHEILDKIDAMLVEAIKSTAERGGKVIIPAFAVERSQELLYRLNSLLAAGRIPNMPIFLDSPMAISVTEVYRKHLELLDEEVNGLIRAGMSPFDLPGLRSTRKREESKNINDFRGPAVIIAGSGMCTGGRIKHHLAHGIDHAENTVLFIGYQAAGTLGGQIAGGALEVRIFGRFFPVRARIEKIEGFSGHADKNELLKWLGALRRPPTRVFVTHGEPDAAFALADAIKTEYGWDTVVPEYGNIAELE